MERLKALQSLHEKILNDKFAEKVTEEEIKVLVELKDKLESGKIIELPCKVGDEIFYTDEWFAPRIIAYLCRDIQISLTKGIVISLTNFADDDLGIIYASNFGKTAFLTEEEAEAKAKEISKKYKKL